MNLHTKTHEYTHPHIHTHNLAHSLTHTHTHTHTHARTQSIRVGLPLLHVSKEAIFVAGCPSSRSCSCQCILTSTLTWASLSLYCLIYFLWQGLFLWHRESPH